MTDPRLLEMVVEVQSSFDGAWRVDPRHRCCMDGKLFSLIQTSYPEPDDELFGLVCAEHQHQHKSHYCADLNRSFAGSFSASDLQVVLEEIASRFCYRNHANKHLELSSTDSWRSLFNNADADQVTLAVGLSAYLHNVLSNGIAFWQVGTSEHQRMDFVMSQFAKRQLCKQREQRAQREALESHGLTAPRDDIGCTAEAKLHRNIRMFEWLLLIETSAICLLGTDAEKDAAAQALVGESVTVVEGVGQETWLTATTTQNKCGLLERDGVSTRAAVVLAFNGKFQQHLLLLITGGEEWCDLCDATTHTVLHHTCTRHAIANDIFGICTCPQQLSVQHSKWGTAPGVAEDGSIRDGGLLPTDPFAFLTLTMPVQDSRGRYYPSMAACTSALARTLASCCPPLHNLDSQVALIVASFAVEAEAPMPANVRVLFSPTY
jgi:hypothetical protein